MILLRVDFLMPYFWISSLRLKAGYSDRISFTWMAVSLAVQFFSPPIRPILSACLWFSKGVVHSRFATWLFSLLPSIWLTSRLLCGFIRKAVATNRLICLEMDTLFL